MKIAGVQMDVKFGEIEANLDRIVSFYETARSEKAELVVFPECAVTGYCFHDREEAEHYAQPIPGPITDTLTAACQRLGGTMVVGMIEKNGNQLFNNAVLLGENGPIGTYRKVHLPFLGLDRFADFGDRPFEIHEVDGVKIGLNICYDTSFPEASRVLSLQGADLIVLPTNWPEGAECLAEHTINVRAMENHVYYIAIDRVGSERGFTFIGRSRICQPGGKTLAMASAEGEEILYAEIDPAKARKKRVDRRPMEHAIDRMADRRPQYYRSLSEPHHLPRPGRND